MRVYLDSCVLIYRVEGSAAFQVAAAAAFDALGRDDVVCISDLVRLECLVKPLRQGDSDLRTAYEAQFARFERLPLPPPVFDLAAELRAQFSLKTPDALHAACAMHHGCDELWTNDVRLSALGERLRPRVVR